MKGMRGTANSLDWDHSVDTQSPQGKQMLPLRRLMTLFVYAIFRLFTDDESDGVEMGRSSSELSNLNEDWDSGTWRKAIER